MTGGRRPTSAARELVVCVDVGSTFTKAAAIDAHGHLVAHAESPTTSATDVLKGLDAAVAALGVGRVQDDALLVCSSAGGGLRLAVVGQERLVSAEAGRRVALSAGARIVGVWAGRLSPESVAAGTPTARPTRRSGAADPSGAELTAEHPAARSAGELAAADVVLLVGGTDGGDQEVLLHNARVLGRSPLRAPVVLAGNQDASAEALALVQRRGRVVLPAANVIPRIGELAPESARAAIRSVFIEHVIGGKGLSRGRRFGRLVRCATPDAVLTGIEVLAARRAEGGPTETSGGPLGDVLAVDVGGATTDVYSVITAPDVEAPAPGAVGQAPAGRTVEGDLGMRWSAPDLLVAAQSERLLEQSGVGDSSRVSASEPAAPAEPGTLAQAAARRHDDVGFLPTSERDRDDELTLARLAATIAVRRHARPGSEGRDLRRVGLVVGSGGVLRHASPEPARDVIRSVLADRAGGWALPAAPAIALDTDYLLAPIGLLAMSGRRAEAEALAERLLLVPRSPG